MRRLRYLMLLLVVLLLAACGGNDAGTEPEEAPSDGGQRLEGQVLNLQREPGSDTASFTLAGLAEEDPFVNATVFVTPQTEIVQGSEPLALDALREGQDVAVTITGPVRESFPVQVDAARVEIRE